MHDYLRRIIEGQLLAPDNGGTSGGSGSADDEEIDDDTDLIDGEDDTDDTEEDTDDEDDKAKDKRKPDDSPAARFERMLGKFRGDTRKLAEQLYRDNYKLRTSRSLARDEAEQLRRQVPRKGAMNITPQEYKEFQAYKKLGTPKEVAAGLASKTQLEQEVSRTKKATTIGKAARAAGFNATVLQELGSDLEYVIETETSDEGDEDVAYVVSTTKENGATVKKNIPLDEYARNHWKVFMRSLTELEGDADDADDEDDDTPRRSAKRNGARNGADRTFIRQSGGIGQRKSSSRDKQSVGGSYIRNRYAPKETK